MIKSLRLKKIYINVREEKRWIKKGENDLENEEKLQIKAKILKQMFFDLV